MKTREQLLRSKGYWVANLQLDLYKQVEEFLKQENNNRTKLAEKLGVTKGYISQVLNGDFDHRISKLVELSMAIGKVPKIEYEDIEQVMSDELDGNKTVKFKVFTNKETKFTNSTKNNIKVKEMYEHIGFNKALVANYS